MKYNNWIYYLWTDFVSPSDSWYPLRPQYGKDTWDSICIHYNKFMHCWFSILGKKFHTCFLGSHSGIFWRQHFPVRGTASHPATLTDAYVKDILSNDRDSRRFFHLMITESLIILREETVILLKGPTRPNIFLQIDLDSWTTCGSCLIFVISFTQTGFSKTKFYTQKND